ncbi:GntR family transcriptional regulator [Pseudomonas sp. BF-RE-26]|uniref:GntR family transcriptional regulator n=1 Tax=Pseudomonas sp. BF-RE-26 TaxID=2832396 RepID=UPI001CBD7C54|nr:GntR family transcriptional regulator [Pseudomonas sp. BF-RE-26]
MSNGKNALYEDLKREILTMELDPGEVLDEVILCERYGLSRTPVREIFRRLAGEGYVNVQENRGVRVVPMNHSMLRNFFQVAPMIYAAIGRLAVHNFKQRQLIELKETQHRFRNAMVARDPTAMVVENNRFHAVMGEMAANQYLLPSLERLLIDHARIGHTVYRPHNEEMEKHLQLSVDQHDLFIEAIERRDEEAVVALVYAHWEPSREKMEMYITPEGMKADGLLIIPA